MSPLDRIILTACVLVIGATIVVGHFDLVPQGAICWSVILLKRECAGCGLTRSFAAIGRGDLSSAFAFNPIGPLLFGAVVLVGALRLARIAAPRFRFWTEFDVAVAAFVAITLVSRLVEFYFL